MSRLSQWIGIFCLAASLCGLVPRLVGAEPVHYVEMIDDCEMDWTTMRLRTRGQGDPDRAQTNLALARNVAIRDAEQAVLAALTQGVYALSVGSGLTVAKRVAGQEDLEASLRKQIRQFRTVETLYYSHGGIAIRAELSVLNFLPRVLSSTGAAVESASGDSTYSGVIVDTSNVAFYPSLAPSLVSEDGTLLYDYQRLSPKTIGEQGVTGYWTTLEDAKRDPRLGKEPLVVQVLRLEKRDQLVLPSHEARLLQSTEGMSTLLAQGRVVLVVPLGRNQ